MTKKRFVKLVMSHGIQRNEAHEIAERYNARYRSYVYAYADFILKDVLMGACESLREAMRASAEGVKSLVLAFEKFRERIKQNENENQT